MAKDGTIAPEPWARGRVRLRASLLIRILLPLIALAVLAVPFFGSGYQVRFMTEMFMLIALAQSWNIIGGITGYISFGHVVFFGVGAYTSGLMITRLDMPFALGLVGAPLVAIVFALLIGLPLLRLRGHYFAVATFAVAEGIRELVIQASDITGGGIGLSLAMVPPPEILVGLFGTQLTANSASYYYLMFGVLLAALLATYLILNRKIGFGLRAIRADEDAAAALGIDRTRSKTIAFAISAIFPAVAGAIYVSWFTYIDAPTVFSVDLSVTMVIMTLLGGIGTLWGPIVGGVLLHVTGELIWGQFLELHTAFLGVVLVLVVLFMPRGVLTVIRRGRGGLRLGTFLQNIRRYSV